LHIANIYVSFIFKCFSKVKEHWLIHKINGENVLNEHQDDIVELLQEAKRPIKITFLHPNHELHPHNHHHHHHHREHTSTITLLDGEKLWFNMKFVDHEFEESYMIIIKVSTDNMQHIRENLKLAYVLSGIGVHHAFNVEEVDTPLHYAAYYGKDILIPYLLYLHPKAAEMKTFTMEYTPLDLARSVSNFSNKKCIELLEDIEGTVFSFRNAQQRDGK
jgi:hypothetical protein